MARTAKNTIPEESFPVEPASAIAAELPADSIVVNLPESSGPLAPIQTEAGKTYIFNFDQNKVESMNTRNGDLVLNLADGRELVFVDYVAVQAGTSPAVFMLGEPILALENPPEETDRTKADSSGRFDPMNAQGTIRATELLYEANFQAGEELAMTSLAESLAQIEPAAGDDAQGGGDDDEDGGFGFQSNFNPSNVVFLEDIGPIGPTALEFGANFRTPELLALLDDTGESDDSGSTVSAPLPPPGNSIPNTSPSGINVDESNIVPGGRTDIGNIAIDFGNDGPGTVTPVLVGGFDFAGSATNNQLSSGGVPVVVDVVGDTFVGTANGVTVFELQVPVDGNGQYIFTQFEPLDHADGNDDNDVIDLFFDVIAEDADGDQVEETITISVADDAPVATDDTGNTDENTPITGNVLTNDDIGEDQPGRIESVTFNGVTTPVPDVGTVDIVGNFGTLTIDDEGNFTFTPNGTPNGSDVFTYRLVDFDGDGDDGVLTINVNSNALPVIDNAALDNLAPLDESNLPNENLTGTIPVDFSFDAPGTITPNDNSFTAVGSVLGGNLTSNGSPIDVTLNGTTFTGRSQDGRDIFTLDIQPNGNFDFTLLDQIDHADGTDPNDVITLNFGFTATDNNGDTATSILPIQIQDDAPVAVDDAPGLVQSGTQQTGNVITNDDVGEDIDGTITQVVFNNVITIIPAGGTAVVNGNFGVLTIGSDGAFTYDANGDGTDVFTYTLRDFDGDTDTATLTLGSIADPGVFVVGNNGDDDANSTDPHVVGGGNGEITGGSGSDILVGDVGGSSTLVQNGDFDIVMALDVSGSMVIDNRLTLLVDAVQNLMADFDAYNGGQVKVHLITFSTDVVDTFTVDFANANALNDVNAFLDSLVTTGGFTNYEAPLQEALAYLSSNEPIGGAAQVNTFFVSDGAPNRFIDESGDVENPPGPTAEEDAIILGQLTGQTVTTSRGTFVDNDDEVGQLQALGEVFGVGISIEADRLANLDAVDSNGQALNVLDPQDLNATLQGLNPVTALDSAGDDVLNGGAGDDFIFGDVLFTDNLANTHGFNTLEGAGFEVFERLEAGQSALIPNWGRATTLQFIRDNAEELGGETINAQGQGRSGGDDTIDGGSGDDTIFGQEGDDDITGGEGDDTLFGGSGSDTFIFENINNGVDTIKDFEATDDLLDISALLNNFDPVQDSINNFVFATESGGNTTIAIDVNGTGDINNAFNLAILEGAAGLNIETITNNGQAVV